MRHSGTDPIPWSRDMSATKDRPLRIIVAKPGLDGHDRGAKIIARALRDAGFEVIYTGLHQTPEMIVAADVAVFGGGIIPQDDVPKLTSKGVSAVFLPGSSTQTIIEWIRANVRPRAAA